MDDFFDEENPAPIMHMKPKFDEHSDCTYLCFYIDKSIYDEQGFQLSDDLISNLSFKEFKFENNIVVLCVYSEGLLNSAFKLFKSVYPFKISYRYKKRLVFACGMNFEVEKNKIKFIYDAGKEGQISADYRNYFKSPSCLEQYKVFTSLYAKKEIILEETKNFLSKTLDLELFLYLIQKEEEKEKMIDEIFNNFPNFRIQYDNNKQFDKIDFESLYDNKYYKKIVLIYSVVQDSKSLLIDFKTNEILELINYNEIHEKHPILIKKNCFELFIEKINEEETIKKICKYVSSIPLLFDYLVSLNHEQIQKIKNLSFEDLPN